ncbi:sugar O-acetyltransferase [Vibrio tubiashii]|uniref:sugar O-acetyltransferase n=1 Tax=Vibrio tubiashii TaxID=29498 RepID=UPI003CE49ECA
MLKVKHKHLKEVVNASHRKSLYNDFSEECHNARMDAANLVKQFYEAKNDAERKSTLTELFNSVGENVAIQPGFRCEYGFNISVGDNTFINWDCIALDCDEINLGSNILIGPRVGLYTANHAIDKNERQLGGCYSEAITIGDNVWLCADVTICGGVKIGPGSIIAGGSVVTKDIPDNVIAGGNPAKVIRAITDDDKTGYVAQDSKIRSWDE